MTLHHIFSTTLYMCCIFSGAYSKVAMMFYLHDLSDISVHFFKVTTSLIFEKFSLVVSIVNVTIWFWTRIILLPIFIYVCATSAINLEIEEEKQFMPYSYFLLTFISVLDLMHFYWFYVFIVSISR